MTFSNDCLIVSKLILGHVVDGGQLFDSITTTVQHHGCGAPQHQLGAAAMTGNDGHAAACPTL